jgi:hypothetical protein
VIPIVAVRRADDPVSRSARSFNRRVIMIDDNPWGMTPIWVARHRIISAQIKSLNVEKKELAGKIEEFLTRQGEDFKDAEGYATIRRRKPSVSYPGREVDALVQSWTNSEDPIMRSCGEMLKAHRQEKPGYEYVYVK